MNTNNKIGWWIIWLCIISLVLDVMVGSINGINGWVNMRVMLWWTYITIAVLIVGIFMAQYKPYNEEE